MVRMIKELKLDGSPRPGGKDDPAALPLPHEVLGAEVLRLFPGSLAPPDQAAGALNRRERARTLHRMADLLSDLADTLEAGAAEHREPGDDISLEGPFPARLRNSFADSLSDRDLARLAAAIYASRQKRSNFLPFSIFGEAAWDILLDLFINHVRGKDLRTTSVCIASNVPPTTGLRWIGTLERHGLLRRYVLPEDNRATLVGLTPVGSQAVRECLRQFCVNIWPAFGEPLSLEEFVF